LLSHKCFLDCPALLGLDKAIFLPKSQELFCARMRIGKQQANLSNGEVGGVVGLGIRGKVAKACVAAGLVGMASVAGRAQEVQSKRMAADAHPVFEVAAIKHSDPNHRNSGIHMNGRHFNIENQTVGALMLFGFGVSKSQVVGAPDWVNSERFDVDGVPDLEGEPGVKQMQEMVRKLLVDRFGLKTHMEQRDMNVYAVTVAKGGPKLKKSESAPDALPDQTSRDGGGIREMKFTNTSMDEFTLSMKFYLDRPVVDKTGLGGKWDFELKWTYDDTRATDPNAPPGLFTAVQEQFGLRLDAVKAPVDVMVVDSVERPTQN